MRNAEQILSIITASFGEELFVTSTIDEVCLRVETDVEDLACRWQRLVETSKVMSTKSNLDEEWTLLVSQVGRLELQKIIPACANAFLQWLGDAQRLLSSMASNYDIPRLTLGQIVAIAATMMAVFAAHQNAGRISTSAIPLTLIITAYGVMMFASSYVEEEHHFWYYTTTAWLAYVSWRGFSG